MRVRYLTFRFFCAEADAAVFLLAGVNRAFTWQVPDGSAVAAIVQLPDPAASVAVQSTVVPLLTVTVPAGAATTPR
jgi:hypothetical protein